MTIYSFNISHGEMAGASRQEVELSDDRAAWEEACFLCRDLSGGIFMDAKPEWRLEVTDQTGKTIFRFRVLADVL